MTPPPSAPTSGHDTAIRAFLVRADGDTVDAGVSTLPADELGDGDVLVAVEWSAVNYKDGMVTRPGNRVARRSPLVPGVDLAGSILASADPSLPVGHAVLAHGYDLGVAHHGGYAEQARVPSGWVVPLPDGLSTRTAAAIGTAGFAAALSVARLERVGLEPGTGPVVVTGAAGGVGSMAVALLAARGYEVVASTRRRTESDYLHELGASDLIGADELLVAPERTLGPERWAGAVDCVGGDTLTAILRTLRYGASVAASGLVAGTALDTTVYPFIIRGVGLLGVDTVSTPIEERRSVWAGLSGAFPAAVLDRLVEDEVTLDGVAGALEAVLAGQVRGRVLVRPGG